MATVRVGLRTESGITRCQISTCEDLLEQVSYCLGASDASAVGVTRHTGEHVTASELQDGDVLIVHMAKHTDDGDAVVVSTQPPDPANSAGWMVVESPTSSQVELETCQVEDALCHEEESPVLCLDLDGTLLHASRIHQEGADLTNVIFPSDPERRRRVTLRPGLVELLAAASQRYDLAVWTAAPMDYAEQCIKIIGREHPGFCSSLRAVMSQEECELEHRGNMQVLGAPVKKLSKLAGQLRVPLHRVLIVDDTYGTYKFNKSNALPVPSFKGDMEDNVLFELKDFLAAMCHDVPLDVSQWKHATVGAKPLVPDHGHRMN